MHVFAPEYFSSKAFMLTTESPDVLVGIAEAEHLRNKLRSITFTTAMVTEDMNRCTTDHSRVREPEHEFDPFCPDYHPTKRQSEVLHDYSTDQADLRVSGRGVSKLVQAFRSLGSISKLAFVDRPSAIASSTDYRGSNKFRRRTGMTPWYENHFEEFRYERYSSWKAHIWTSVLIAVAQSVVSISELEASSMGIHLKLLSSELNLEKWFRTLERLRLTIEDCVIIDDHSRESSGGVTVLANAIGSDLRSLHMICGGKTCRLYSTLFADGLPLGNLTELKLSDLFTNSAMLLRVTKALASVVKLEFNHVDLQDGSWVPVLKTIQKLDRIEELHLVHVKDASRPARFLAQPDPADYLAEDHPPVYTAAEHGGMSRDRRLVARTEAFEGLHCAPGYRSWNRSFEPARGYYVCVHGKIKIAEVLPVLIDEYNLSRHDYP